MGYFVGRWIGALADFREYHKIKYVMTILEKIEAEVKWAGYKLIDDDGELIAIDESARAIFLGAPSLDALEKACDLL